jgi:AraC-like DNA-binding protein
VNPGEPALAAELLREPRTTIGAAATRVGFSNAFALSAAFKKTLYQP